MLYYNLLRSHWIWLFLSTSKLKGTGTLHMKMDCNFSKTIVTLTYTWSRKRRNVTFLSRTNGQLWQLNNYKSLTGLFFFCMSAKSERKGRLIVCWEAERESRRRRHIVRGIFTTAERSSVVRTDSKHKKELQTRKTAKLAFLCYKIQ